ncbi:MAG: FkbM family methyltransferase [Nitrososphaerota archaeon]|nr:FkbM family methyltransferase [Nitrososphaerota archaeon]
MTETARAFTDQLVSLPLDVGSWMAGNNRFGVRLFPRSMGANMRYYRGWRHQRVEKAGPGLVTGSFQGRRMLLDLGDKTITRTLIQEGVWEPYETELVKKLAAGARVAVDVGAQVGYYSLMLGGTAGKVYAFEPEERNFDLLCRNVETNGLGNVVCTRKAVSDHAGKAELYIDGQNHGNHNLWSGGAESQEVETVTLDKALADEADRVDLVKMDIQGAEGLALAGTKRVLSESKRLRLLTEYWPHALTMLGTDPHRFLASLRDSGFSVYQINEITKGLDETIVLDEADPLACANLLCLRRP